MRLVLPDAVVHVVAQGEEREGETEGGLHGAALRGLRADVKEIRIADLYSGSGGAAFGLHLAAESLDVPHKIVGFDIEPMPRYPAFHDAEYAQHFEFHQADALEVDLSGFDAVWASPPCQGYSMMTNNLPWHRDRDYPLLILPTREKLGAVGKPYIIENVYTARYGSKVLERRGVEAHGMKAGWLCGQMFGLPLYRHRLFETNWFWLQPGHPKHRLNSHPRAERWVYGGKTKGLPGGSAGLDTKPRPKDGAAPGLKMFSMPTIMQGNGAQGDGVGVGHAKGWKKAAEAMEIPWMRREELTQAIPPVFSEYLGHQLLKVIATNTPPTPAS